MIYLNKRNNIPNSFADFEVGMKFRIVSSGEYWHQFIFGLNAGDILTITEDEGHCLSKGNFGIDYIKYFYRIRDNRLELDSWDWLELELL